MMIACYVRLATDVMAHDSSVYDFVLHTQSIFHTEWLQRIKKRSTICALIPEN